MIGKMVIESLLKNIRITLWTLVTLTTSAALVAMFSTMSIDVEKKMNSALRKLGPNAVAVPHRVTGDRQTASDDWKKIEDAIQRKGISAAEINFEITTVAGKPVVLAMSEPEKLARMTPYWFVSGQRARAEGECLVGKHAAELLKLKPGMSIRVHSRSDSQKETDYTVTGVFVSGDENENRIFVPGSFAEIMKRGLTVALLSIPDQEEGIERFNAELRRAQIPVEIKPLREIVHGEKTTLKKIGLLSAVSLLAVLILTVLGVSSALLSRIVERRKEFALLEAIGATRRSLTGFLLLECAVTGTAASIAGFVLGTFISEIVVRKIFHASVTPQFIALALTFIITLGISLITGSSGVIRVLKMKPASALRGE